MFAAGSRVALQVKLLCEQGAGNINHFGADVLAKALGLWIAARRSGDAIAMHAMAKRPAEWSAPILPARVAIAPHGREWLGLIDVWKANPAARVWFAPVPYGFAEQHPEESLRPPTWLAVAELDGSGAYVRGPRAPRPDPVTGFVPATRAVEVRAGEPALNSGLRHVLGRDFVEIEPRPAPLSTPAPPPAAPAQAAR